VWSGIDVPETPRETATPTVIQLCTASYFPSAGLHLLRGRFFSDNEVAAIDGRCREREAGEALLWRE
jgi:hypothetical protein